MIKQTWKELFQSRWFKIVMIAIILIPSLYAGIFLGSMWDPYGNSKDIPVAIVNEDIQVSYNNQNLSVGKELVKNLRKNNAMDFQFVNAKTAETGLKKGTYYMMITIPSNFSKCATTLLSSSPEKMTLNYKTNPGTNYIASKMDDTAINKIKSEISTYVTKTYAKTIFDQIQTLSTGLSKAANATDQLNQGSSQIVSGNQSISDNLNILVNSSLSFVEGNQTLSLGLKDYTKGVTLIKEGSTNFTEGFNAFSDGVNQSYLGSQTLINNNDTLLAASKQLSEGIKQLSSGNQNVVNGVNLLSSSSKTANDTLTNYLTFYELLNTNPATQSFAQTLKENGLSAQEVSHLSQGKMTKALPSFETMLNSINTNLSTLNNSIDTNLKVGVNQVQQGLNNLDAAFNGGEYISSNGQKNISVQESFNYGINAYLQGSKDLNTGLKQLNANRVALMNGNQQINTSLRTLSNSNSSLLSGGEKLYDGSKQFYSGSSQLLTGSNTLATGLITLNQGVGLLNQNLNDGAEKSQIETSDATYDMMSNPIDVNLDEISTVENNGHAMAPYMMSVGLYVSCLAFALMYPLLKNIKKAKSGFQYWLSKASIWFTISSLSSLLMIFSLILFNGFHPQQMFMTFIFTLLVAAGFMSFITLISIASGKIGEFILLIFMVINLGGSAGTYPIETSASIYQWIHPLMPFTYSVDGFRKTIAMNDITITSEMFFFIIMILSCSMLTIAIYQYRIRKAPIISQAFEEVE